MTDFRCLITRSALRPALSRFRLVLRFESQGQLRPLERRQVPATELVLDDPSLRRGTMPAMPDLAGIIGLQPALQNAVKSITGTFNTSAAYGLGSGSVDRIAKATEETATHTKTIADHARRNRGLVYGA